MNTPTTPKRSLKLPSLRLAVLFLVVVAAFGATTGAASAKTSCGVQVVDDWYGGHLGKGKKTYPLHCYRDALNIVAGRADISLYSNARQDILLALQAAIAHKNGGPFDPTGSIATADALPSFLGGPDAKNGGHAPPGDIPYTLLPRTHPGSSPIGILFRSSSASSVPLPAIVLGAVAALLLALGSVAYFARRRQLRRQTLLPQAESGPQNP